MTRCLKCGALEREDLIFAADLSVYGIARQRWFCTNGHSRYTAPAPAPTPRRLPDRTCAYCGDPLGPADKRLHAGCKGKAAK